MMNMPFPSVGLCRDGNLSESGVRICRFQACGLVEMLILLSLDDEYAVSWCEVQMVT
jgi:hypothetical protein